MRSIFRYPGGKTRRTIQRWILSYRPDGLKEYREPFVGGGGVFFAVEPRDASVRWVNDVNEGLIEVYRALAVRPEDFIARCRVIPPAHPDDPMTGAGVEGGKPQNARLKAIFDAVRLDRGCDQAFRYFFINRTVFGGRVNYDRPSRLYFSKPQGWDVVKGDHLERAARWLTDVRVTCGDFEPLFQAPGEDVWIYADPPYCRNTDFTGNSKLYQHSFTRADHERLAQVVRECPHRVALSYDDDPFVRSLYQGMHFVEQQWAYCGSTNGHKDRGRELLILNYDPPQRTFFMVEGVRPAAGLSPEDVVELARCEEVLERHRRSAFEAGAALRTIRDRRLYRGEHQTFEEYCRGRWGMSRIQAHRLIDSASVVEQLALLPAGNKQPETEWQVRPLTTLRDENGALDGSRIAEAWSAAVERAEAEGKPVTAKLVREVVEEMRGEPSSSRGPVDRVERLWRQVKGLNEEERRSLLDLVRQEWADALEPALTTGE